MRSDQAVWDDAATVKLAGLYFSTPKPSIEAMAVALGRTPQATWNFIARIGMATPGAQMRKCMPCERQFFSTHIGNRICSRCADGELMRCA
jgi:hypothetical protein